MTGINYSTFSEAFDVYWEELFRYARRVLQKPDVCEDIIQEIFLSLWKNRETAEIKDMRAYLYQALKNQIYKYHRDSNFENFDIDNFVNFLITNDTQNVLNQFWLNEAVNYALTKLPDGCREVFYHSRVMQLSHTEIAQKLMISEQTVKNQINKAIKIMRIHLKDYLVLLILTLL